MVIHHFNLRPCALRLIFGTAFHAPGMHPVTNENECKLPNRQLINNLEFRIII